MNNNKNEVIKMEKNNKDYKELNDKYNKLNDRCDDLEAKNYQLKADLDRIINNINLNNKGGEWWQCIAEGTT